MDFKTGVGEFSFWRDLSHGECYWRKGNNFYKDEIVVSEAVQKNKCVTSPITKTEYLKKLSEYGKTLQKERM